MSEESDVEQLRELGFALHERLLSGDVTAPAEIAEAFMEPVTIGLQRRFSQLDDPHLINEAVIDAILNYFNRPQQYNPTKRSLAGYLYMSAKGDLINLLQKHKRETGYLALVETVELGSSDSEHGVEIQDDFDVETWVLNQNSPIWQWLPQLLPDSTDQEIILLMMDGVRETVTYADVLGILDYPADEQAAIVKRNKERVKKKLQRNIERAELRKNE